MKFTGLKYYLVIWRNRIVALIVLAILSLTFIIIRNRIQDQTHKFERAHSEEYYQYEKYMDSIELAEKQHITENPSQDVEPKSLQKWAPKPIHPNQASEEQWLNLGLNEGQVATIKKYLDKGGAFSIKSDLKKIYTIDQEDYNRIEPFLLLPDSSALYSKQTRDSFYSKVDRIVDESPIPEISVYLNESEAEDYRRIRGLGEVLSNRIIKYRDLLGGFYKKEQLLEVYGIDSSLFAEIELYLVIDEKDLEHLDINQLTAYEMSKHPYVTYNMALIITRDRKKNGPFKMKEDLLNRELLNEHLYSKIAPYITIK